MQKMKWFDILGNMFICIFESFTVWQLEFILSSKVCLSVFVYASNNNILYTHHNTKEQWVMVRVRSSNHQDVETFVYQILHCTCKAKPFQVKSST